jgi:hypothetical protein
MNRNVGAIDRTLRIVIGFALIGLAVSGTGTPWTWIGIVPLLTGTIGWCPAYRLFGVRTCHAKRHERDAANSPGNAA